MRNLPRLFAVQGAVVLCAGLALAAVSHGASAAISDGAVIKTDQSPDVYIVKLYGGKRFKRLILNPQVFDQYRHLKWENIQIVSSQTLDLYVTSNLVRAQGDIRVYKLYPNGDAGTKRQIADPATFTALSCDWDAIFEINNFERDLYTVDVAAPDQCPVIDWTSGGGSGTGTGSGTPPPPPPAGGTSDATYRGEYWNLPSGSGNPPLFPTIAPQVVRNDTDINFDWGYGAPASGISADRFAVRWTKNIFLPAGNYAFFLTSDDGARLWVDSTPLINTWFDHNAYTYSGGWVSSGQTYHLRVEYYENQYQAVAKLGIVKQ